MLLDVTTQSAIDPLIWHSLPDAEDGILQNEIWKCGPIVCTMLKNPACKSGEDLVVIPYAMVARRGKDLVLAVTLEQEDLRALSYKLGCSLKELQEDYQTKGFYSELRGYLYTNEHREDLGLYDGNLDLQSLRVFFMENICDTFDLMDEPVLVRT